MDLVLFGEQVTLTDHAQLAAAIDLIPMAQTVDVVLHGSIQSQPLLDYIQKHGVEWYERKSFANATS